ncbi:MAG: ATP-binding cassette domain-containing protein [Corynebacterium sp.]|nr:ATP-binding cassette domain-containing protein [Corynebacterium sp.]
MITTNNFHLASGLTHALVGANGTGKTTLLRQIAGQLPADNLRVFGEEPFDNQRVMDRTILMGIDNPLPDAWSAGGIVKLGAARWETWNQQRAEKLLEAFAVPNKRYSSLSRGQKSALGIVLAVASGCELMLLDEPYLGLDPDKREIFYQVLADERGRTIVIATHHLDELSTSIDTVSALDVNLYGAVEEIVEGVVELIGTPEHVAAVTQKLGVEPLMRDSSVLGERVVIDARTKVDAVYAAARGVVKVNPVSLQRAVSALQLRNKR